MSLMVYFNGSVRGYCYVPHGIFFMALCEGMLCPSL